LGSKPNNHGSKKIQRKKAPPARNYKELVESIESSESSVFSKEDVLRLLGECRETSDRPQFTQDQLAVLIQRIVDELDSQEWDDIIDDYDLEMNGNYVELTGCHLNTSGISDVISEVVEDWESEI
jgi:hypothetical protein